MMPLPSDALISGGMTRSCPPGRQGTVGLVGSLEGGGVGGVDCAAAGEAARIASAAMMKIKPIWPRILQAGRICGAAVRDNLAMAGSIKPGTVTGSSSVQEFGSFTTMIQNTNAECGELFLGEAPGLTGTIDAEYPNAVVPLGKFTLKIGFDTDPAGIESNGIRLGFGGATGGARCCNAIS